MLYSSAGLLALVIHLIINHDVLRGVPIKGVVAHRSYRRFLGWVTVYYLTDIMWGLLYERRLMTLVHADTSLYFISMAFSILCWTRYAIDYLQEKGSFARLLSAAGWLIFAFQILFVPVNFFMPVLFSFDAAGVYHAEAGRYATLAMQIAMFLGTTVYALAVTSRKAGTTRLRYGAIGLCSLVMTAFIILQAVFSLLPMYAVGCLLTTCLLHTFVLENEREEYRGTLEVRLQENIEKGNYTDLLTGLPGMTYFFELADKRRAALRHKGAQPVFLYINLTGMKFYNQTHGFAGGDRLLQALARLLIAAFGQENCSRFGRDHFAVFTEQPGLEDKLRGLIADWEALGGEDRPAILVGVYPDSLADTDVSSACDLAKLACDAVRHSYVSAVKVFDSDMLAHARQRQYVLTHLDRAIADGWIQVYYQPIVRAANGRVCDEEALARWIDPQKGLLAPGDFIPILEDAKLIYRLDLCVVEQVLAKMTRLQARGLYLVPQSVNLSRSDFEMCDMVEEIRRRVDDAGFERRLITIEITESIIGSDFDFIKGQVERFRALGFPVWMDDFGSGYSSLDVLQSMPVDLIKFDMRFMQQFNHEAKSRIILTELMKMAVGLGIDTVCEGVERADQVEFLREIGCSKLQGYYYTKPLSLPQLLDRYENGEQIGFENPEETGYFDTIGRVNLYDLSALAGAAGAVGEASLAFRHYFSTVPMAVIEFSGDRVRFVRCNPSYRDFMTRAFRMDDGDLDDAFRRVTDASGQPFIAQLRRCCREGGRAVFDDTLPGGETVHAFMRFIAENPANGTVAVAVAVLTVGE